MKRVLAMAAAPLLVSAAFTGAVAEEHKVGADAPQQTESDEMGPNGGIDPDIDATADPEGNVDVGTTASTGAEANFGSVISAIQTSGTASADIEAVTDASQVEVVRVSDLAEGESMNAVDEALANNQSSVDELRTAVEANAAISQRLEEDQVQTGDVVAAETAADGSVTLYVR